MEDRGVIGNYLNVALEAGIGRKPVQLCRAADGCSTSTLEPLGNTVSNLQTALIQCPYCWEQIEVVVDCSVRRQEYVEDCSVCCRPIVITAVTSGGAVVSIEGRSEDE